MYPPPEKATTPPPAQAPNPNYPTHPQPSSTYNYYPNPPPAGPGGYPQQYGQSPQVVEGIPMGMNSPQSLGIQTTPQQTGYWSTGLCDCFNDPKNCCFVCWCPCVAFGQISEIVDKGTSSCGCNGSLYMGLCLLGGVGTFFGIPMSCQWIYSCTYRGKLKHDMNMPQSCCEDCCVHFWCEPCALCQEYRELQNRGFDLPLGWNGNQEKRRQQPGNGIPAMVAAPTAPSMDR